MRLSRAAYLLGACLRAGCTVFLVLPACSAPGETATLGVSRPEVRGGKESLPCEWPAVVALDLGCSGTLVHPEVVLYAAHCGQGIREIVFGADASQPERVVQTKNCVAHPEAALGNGRDIAFCLLAEPVDDVPSLRVAAGCELDALGPETPATLVGFGSEREGDAFGVKRSAQVTLGMVGSDLTIDAQNSGSCAGDSGGPLLVHEPTSSSGPPGEERLIGVVSAAEDADCGPSVDHYSYLPPLLPWLEDASGRDLTPCFDTHGNWHPTPLCTRSSPQRAADESGVACEISAVDGPPATTCGEAFPAEKAAETTVPQLELIVPAQTQVHLEALDGVAETRLEARASDNESGVAEVRFELFDDQGVARAEHRDEVPPYSLERLRLPRGTWNMRVTARDHAFNERRQQVSFFVSSPSDAVSCALASKTAWRSTHPNLPGLTLLMLAVAYGVRRRSRTVA